MNDESNPTLYVDVIPRPDWTASALIELRRRLETLHEQVKGRNRDYVNKRTKDRYHERGRGVRLAIDELDKLLEQLA